MSEHSTSEEESLISNRSETIALESENDTQLSRVENTVQQEGSGSKKFLRLRLTPMKMVLFVFVQLVICASVAVAVHFLWTVEPPSVPHSNGHFLVTKTTTSTSYSTKIPIETTPTFIAQSTHSNTTNSTRTATSTIAQPIFPSDGRFENCDDVCYFVKAGKIKSQPVGFATHGTKIKLYPKAFKGKAIHVYCQCAIDGAWLVFQRRFDGSVDFNRTWRDYKEGFGNLSGEFWLGLQALNTFTRDGPVAMRVDLKNWKSNSAYAQYATFTTSREFLGYFIVTGGYEGTAGDSLASHNGVAFDTFDHPNMRDFPGSCSAMYGGAWWYTNCAISSLNGKTSENIFWSSWDSGIIVATEMKIRPV